MITQLLLMLFGAVLPPEMAAMHFDSTFALLALGLLTLATYPSGLFSKVQDWAGWGITLTFSGLAGAVAGCYQTSTTCSIGTPRASLPGESSAGTRHA